MLSSDLASRLTEGRPGEKDTSSAPDVANERVAAIEGALAHSACELFRARYVEWRPVSNSMANLAVLRALTKPGDVICVQSMSAGANVSYHTRAGAGLLGLRVEPLPGTPEFEIDAYAALEVIERTRPKVVVIGGSKVLFRYPMATLRAAARSVGARILYDAAHVAIFSAAGLFDDPLADGADVMTTGTHKMTGGPVGGLVLTNDAAINHAVASSLYPAFLQTRDLNKYAAASIALAEMIAHRHTYAADVSRNARHLGAALRGHGFTVIGADRGYTDTHMLVLDFGAGAHEFAAACGRQGLLLTKTNIFGEVSRDNATSGIRLSLAQVTRQGMGIDDMDTIAAMLAGIRSQGTDLRGEVQTLARSHDVVRYSFDEQLAR